MPCRGVQLPGGATAIVSTRGQRSRRCSSCKASGADRLCDYPVTLKGKAATCDRPLCARCAVRKGPDRDYCPPHERLEAKHDQQAAP